MSKASPYSSSESAKTKMNVLNSLKWAREFLAQHGIEHPRRNSELLLSHLLHCSPLELYLNCTSLNSKQLKELTYFLDKRKKGLPIAYISGVAEFMGVEFIVNPSVFIPRPETELLVETTINLVTQSNQQRQVGRMTGQKDNRPITILDIGTGCGNIAISLTKYLTHCRIIATDVSQGALRVAQRNCQLHRAENSVSFFKGDLFSAFSNRGKKIEFEIIVSNPPYIPSNQLKSLPLEVRHEPVVALDGGEDGLYYTRRIITEAPQYLVKGGYLIMEIGFGQLKSISEIICTRGRFRLVDVIRDYANIERIIVAQKKV